MDSRLIHSFGFTAFIGDFRNFIVAPFGSLLMGNVQSLVKIHNGPLWFLPCLFVVKIIYWGLFKLTKGNKAMLAGAVVLTMVIGYFTKYLAFNDNFPWSINTAMIVTVFFAAGSFIRPYSNFIESVQWWMILFVVVVHIYLVTVINREAFWAVNSFGNPVLTLIAAFLGILTFIYISNLIKPNKFFDFIGKNTLTIFALHYPMLAMIKEVALPFLVRHGLYFTDVRFREIDFDISIHPTLLVIALVFGLIQLAIVYPVIQVLRRRLPAVIGQSKKRS